jgi:flavin-dependent dehydrogenase
VIDVLIAGGGVAGCAAAIGLARRGCSVAILARARERSESLGETLPPYIRALLAELCVWGRFLSDAHAPSYGMYSAWGESELYSNDFIFHPRGPGWRLDRKRFDEMLEHAAREAGAMFYPGAPADCIAETGAGWDLSMRGGGSLRARLLVDATGRAASLARKTGARRHTLDRTVAVARSYRVLVKHASADSFTLVETSPHGWWYSARLPSGDVAVLFFTDPEFRRHYEPPPHTAARLRGCQCVTEPKVYAASSSCLDRVAGQRWLAVGDAASTWDPLSSQGIAKALQSSSAAAAAIADHFGGDSNAISSYAAQAQAGFHKYLGVRQHYYGREKRWPASPFWRRRQ